MNKREKILITIALIFIFICILSFLLYKNRTKRVSLNNNVTLAQNILEESFKPIQNDITFKSFIVMKKEKTIDFIDWYKNSENIDSTLYYKKVTEYSEYKELMDSYSTLRKINAEDFKNFFAVLILPKDNNKEFSYKYITYEQVNEKEIMNINVDCKDNVNNEETLYSGIVVIFNNKYLQNDLNISVIK